LELEKERKTSHPVAINPIPPTTIPVTIAAGDHFPFVSDNLGFLSEITFNTSGSVNPSF
jgi:hypothetical protein